MDHLLANGEKPIPEADDEDEESALEASSAAEAKVRALL
jgi:hypothetical protein